MMRLMHIDASSKRPEWSNSRALGQYFIQQFRNDASFTVDIDYLDVATHPLPHINAMYAEAIYIAPEDRTQEMKEALRLSDALCERVLKADALVCAMPMYNWTIPSTFKTFIDHITRIGVTYNLKPDGTTEGRLSHKKVLFITTRGADVRPGSPYADMDAMTPVLKTSFAFIGVQKPDFVDAQPLQFSDKQAQQDALIRARRELDHIAERWSA